MGLVGNMLIAARNTLIQISSLVTVAVDLYSTSAKDQDTVLCFFIFYEIGESPSVIKYPVKEHLVIGQAPQSESQ